MKSEIRIKVAADEWKNSLGPNGGTRKYTVPKAIKLIVQSFKQQNIVPVVNYEGEYAVIQAAA